jgi:hypothetical protein
MPKHVGVLTESQRFENFQAYQDARKHPQTELEKIHGGNGPVAHPLEQARIQVTLNMRTHFAASLRSLEGFENRCNDSKQSRIAYENCYSRTLKLGEDLAKRTGEVLSIPGYVADKSPPPRSIGGY